jgi:DNA modification methylase
MIKRNNIYNGDVLETLRTFPEGIFNTCVTSPPYWGLRDYGVEGQIGLESTPDEYVEKMVGIFREVRRVLRDDGTLWLNLGDSYATNASAGNKKFGNSAFNKNRPSREQTKTPKKTIPNGLKQKDLVGIPWRVALALQADGWYLRSDIIWCLSGGTRVYVKTQKGEMPMSIKDLVRLDPSTVRLWNGEKWTRVLGWSQTPRPDVSYEIELRSGERIGCTAGHVWPTERGNVRTDELQVGDVIKTCRLPEPENVKQPFGLDDELVGWFIGLYIAEGSRSGDAIQIASHTKETERFEKLKKVAEAYHGTCRMHKTGENVATINLYGRVLTGILDTYVSGRIAKDKHLSVRCWQRSDDFLMAVLKGYLSGDGHYDEKNDRYRIAFTNNDNWAADLRTLCARLGVSLRLKRAKHTMNGKEFPGYRGQIRFSVSDHHNNRPDSEIVAIRRSRARQFWDIGVEDEPHLFALASGVLTHNSKPNAMPESVKDRPTKAHEYIFLLSKSPKYYYDADAIKEPLSASVRSRADYMPKDGKRNKRTVWSVSTRPFKGAHFAVFPPDLIEPCILAGSPEGGLVLDPFFGSGTTGLVARQNGRDFVGIELNPEYIEIARERLGIWNIN